MTRGLARRYARALAEILFAAKLTGARKTKYVQQTKTHLEEFAELLAAHAGLRNSLASPALSMREKLGVLDSLKKKLEWDETLRNFIAVLVENRRMDELGAILESFDEDVYARVGIVPVEITTAIPLTKKDQTALEKQLARLTGSEVELRYRQDDNLLGGVVARIGSTIYNGSLRAHLDRLSAQLARR